MLKAVELALSRVSTHVSSSHLPSHRMSTTIRGHERLLGRHLLERKVLGVHLVLSHIVVRHAVPVAMPLRMIHTVLLEAGGEPNGRWLLLLLLSILVALAMLVKVKVHVFLALVWVVATVPHTATSVLITLLSSVAGEVFDRLILDKHWLPGAIDKIWASESLALLVVEDSIILCLGYLMRSSHW